MFCEYALLKEVIVPDILRTRNVCSQEALREWFNFIQAHATLNLGLNCPITLVELFILPVDIFVQFLYYFICQHLNISLKAL